MKKKVWGLFFSLLSFLFLSTNIYAWTLDKSRVDWSRTKLTKVEQIKFDIFQNAIHHLKLDPRAAAEKAGDTDFKRISDGTYQIRLSKKARVKFLIDWTRKIVTILQVGGHTFVLDL